MKRFLLSLGILASITASAQLSSGGQAPDFSTTDINGNPIDLTDILDSGKSVFMDISATWCSPCWAVHEAHLLDDMYYSYGAGGSDEVAVLFFEGDASTTMDDLYGTGSSTQGDWVTGTPYNIINDDTIASTYAIGYWPTFYTICPDGTLTHIDQTVEGYLTASAFASYFSNTCNMSLEGVPNHAKIYGPESFYRCGEGATDIQGYFKNFGNNVITSATIELQEDGTTLATADFSGSVESFSEGLVVFEDIQLSSESDYKIVLTSINGGAPYSSDAALTETPIDFVDSEQTSTREIQILVTTDSYPTEISWNLEDSMENEIFAVGPYAGSDANTTITYDITLPDADDCYTINYYDSYGDGWGYNPAAGIQVIAGDVTVYSEIVGTFGTELNRTNAFGVDVLGLENAELSTKFAVYPNPTSGIVNIKSLEASDIIISDMTGKTVAEFKGAAANATLDLSHLAKGVYILQSSNDEMKEVKKLIIK